MALQVGIQTVNKTSNNLSDTTSSENNSETVLQKIKQGTLYPDPVFFKTSLGYDNCIICKRTTTEFISDIYHTWKFVSCEEHYDILSFYSKKFLCEKQFIKLREYCNKNKVNVKRSNGTIENIWDLADDRFYWSPRHNSLCVHTYCSQNDTRKTILIKEFLDINPSIKELFSENELQLLLKTSK